jgi:hypothetical protein
LPPSPLRFWAADHLTDSETRVARYKVLKSVAHNLAHSFVSVMNYAGTDYTMCHLIRQAKRTGSRVLRIDFIDRSVGPVELLNTAILRSVEAYSKDFGRLVTASGAALDMIDAADLEIRVAIGRVTGRATKELHGRVKATMRILDDRGRAYIGHAVEDYPCAPLR